MKTHNLTIIIPHYNSADMLGKLLSTIPPNKNIEVIVVDDKSEESHITSIRKMEESEEYINFTLLSNKTAQKGTGTARNIGLKKATGTWILFADADDYFTDIFYESISHYFENNNDIVFFSPTSIYIDTKEMADRHLDICDVLNKYMDNKSKENELNLRFNIFPPWAKLIKKDFLDDNKITFDEVIAANDVMFSTKVGYFMKNFEVSDSTVYVITRNHGSLTANMSESVFDIRFKIIINYHNFLKGKLMEDYFKLLNLSHFGREYIVRSMKFGMLKTFKVIFELKKNNFKFFHAKLLNPLHVASKIFQYKKNKKKNVKYMTSEKILKRDSNED